MASGWATSSTYEGRHWDATRAERGDTALSVKVRFERILNADLDDILSLNVLKSSPLISVNWATPASGIEIKDGVEDLETLWEAHTRIYELNEGSGATGIEGALTMVLRRHRARERRLRHGKLDEAKAKHGGRLPCEACGFDFYEVYGEIGKDFAHVHHLKPLGDMTRPSETTLTDLAVVCANCHAMIHRGNEARPLEGLFPFKG